jgi:hypothetical protein
MERKVMQLFSDQMVSFVLESLGLEHVKTT